MKRINVCFSKYYVYEIEVPDDCEVVDDLDDELFNEAYNQFRADMCRPVADTTYDDFEILGNVED